MIYKKGTFGIVPNKHLLSGIDPLAQIIYVWLCFIGNKDGMCYPSMKYLMSITNIKSRTTIENKIQILIDLGLISKTSMKKPGSKYSNNKYYVLLTDGCPFNDRGCTPGVQGVVHQVDTNNITTVTIPNNIYNKSLPFNDNDNQTGVKEETVPTEVTNQKDINILLAIWNKYNPAVGYNNRANRNALQDLLKVYTLEEAKEFINMVISIQDEPYAPSITTPYEMKIKQVKINQYLDRKNKSSR